MSRNLDIRKEWIDPTAAWSWGEGDGQRVHSGARITGLGVISRCIDFLQLAAAFALLHQHRDPLIPAWRCATLSAMNRQQSHLSDEEKKGHIYHDGLVPD